MSLTTALFFVAGSFGALIVSAGLFWLFGAVLNAPILDEDGLAPASEMPRYLRPSSLPRSAFDELAALNARDGGGMPDRMAIYQRSRNCGRDRETAAREALAARATETEAAA